MGVSLSPKQGAHFRRVVAWTNPDGTPIPRGNWTAHMHVRRTPEGTALLTLAEGTGLTLDATSVVVDIVLTPSQTLALPTARLLFDLLLVDTVTDERVWLIEEGELLVRRAITRLAEAVV